MKELQQHLREEVPVEVTKQITKQQKFLGTVKPHKGQTVWQLNLDTKQITPATFSEINYVITVPQSKKGVHKKLVIQEGCIYNVALNKENAKRKFLNRLKRMV